MTETTDSEGRTFFNAMFWTLSEFWRHDILDRLQAVSEKETDHWIRDLGCGSRASLLALAKRVEEEMDIHRCAEFLPDNVAGASFAIAVKAVANVSAPISRALLPEDIGTLVSADHFKAEFDREIVALMVKLGMDERADSEAQHGSDNPAKPLDYRPGIDYQIGRDC